MDAPTWTPSGVRLRAARRNPGTTDWLFLPGGPGIGSESLAELVDVVDVPGTSWLVDLPGDGSNVDAPGAPPDPYALWPGVFREEVDAVREPVCVGHSTGGEYLLSVPSLERSIRGLALVDTAPDARWMPVYEAMTRAAPLPGVTAAAERYVEDPSDARLARVAVESAPWNFTAAGLEAGRALLGRMPYNRRAVDWSDRHFDRTYTAAWWPASLPTLVLGGGADRIVTQTLWTTSVSTGITCCTGPSPEPGTGRGSTVPRPSARRSPS
ncbi:alpha/beta hydrolase [Nakamurella endophytica]|uniref:Alpha/beta hydrolase n=1 Tax=Nakamurella endophytica TaxID=1748367 RepID=A0A917SNH4_9ACTN|nr:alpha/beta hydrolase [Nakamurella endophytica]GGL89685.1 alpha/beta hydrolase [Nakamurella endophytica]